MTKSRTQPWVRRTVVRKGVPLLRLVQRLPAEFAAHACIRQASDNPSQQETFGIDVRLYNPRWHETFACREAGIVISLFRAQNSLFGSKNSLFRFLGNSSLTY